MLSWVGAVALLHDAVIASHLAAFNAENQQHRKYLRREMFEYLQTALPNQEQDLGKVMEQARLLTLSKVKSQKAARKMAGIANVKWTERGPNNVGGRSRGLSYDPNDSAYRKVWTGGIAGGIFLPVRLISTQKKRDCRKCTVIMPPSCSGCPINMM